MNETIPNYIIELKNELKDHFDNKIEKEVGDLALITAKGFADIEKRMATKEDLEELRVSTKDDLNFELGLIRDEMATKKEVKEILEHIGRYEVRAQNTESTVRDDHKPRLIKLEEEVFA